jgi:hypothetical protein
MMPDDAEANLLPQPHTPLCFHRALSADEGSGVAEAERMMISGSSFAYHSKPTP